MKDIRYKKDFAEKKSNSCNSIVLEADDFDDTEELLVFNLPQNVMVTDCYVAVETAMAGATLTVKIDTTNALTNVSLASAGTIHRGAVATVNKTSGTGKQVTVTPNIAITSGKFVLTIVYIEFTRGVGNYTE